MFRPYTTSTFTDDEIKEFQVILSKKTTEELLEHKTDIISILNKDYNNKLLLDCLTYEAKDGFIYELSPDRTMLQVVGAKLNLKGIDSFICVADTVAPEAFKIIEDKEDKGEGSPSNNYIYTLYLPFCTQIAPNSFDGICHAIKIDAPNLAEERALKYLLSLMEKYKDQIDLTATPAPSSTRTHKAKKP